ncbi:MAG: response regulator [Bacteroidia bacterium]
MKPTVLLLDDNSIVNFISRKTIEDSAFAGKIIEFTSGKKALKFLEQNEKNQAELPDIIFLDIKMQLMNGFEFLDHFILLPESIRKKTQIVMLTSSLIDFDRERALKYENVIEFLNKPVTREKLNNLKIKLFA